MVEVKHPFSEEYAVMRKNLFDPLLALAQNSHREHESFAFFESGKVFDKK